MEPGISAMVNGHPATLMILEQRGVSVFAKKLQTVASYKEIELNTGGGMVKATIAPARWLCGFTA
jgi:hypothetical protein